MHTGRLLCGSSTSTMSPVAHRGILKAEIRSPRGLVGHNSQPSPASCAPVTCWAQHSPVMNSITASMGKKGPTWSREFDSLIRAIGECKSKAEEDALISKEVEILKPRLKDPKMDKRWLKELLVRLIYVEMLGQDASWAHVKALQACSETNLITKKVAFCFKHDIQCQLEMLESLNVRHSTLHWVLVETCRNTL